jgi:hypothetical protein
LSERTASSYAYAVSAVLRQLLVGERLPGGVSLEKLRLGLREALAHGDYLRRRVDPRINAFVAWVGAQPIPPADAARNSARLEALRARAVILTLYCSSLRREDAIRANVNARGPGDGRTWVFVLHGNRRRRDDRLSPWSIWSIVKNLARQAEIADPQFAGLSRALQTHDTRHHFARTVLNAGAGLSVVQDHALSMGHRSRKQWRPPRIDSGGANSDVRSSILARTNGRSGTRSSLCRMAR